MARSRHIGTGGAERLFGKELVPFGAAEIALHAAAEIGNQIFTSPWFDREAIAVGHRKQPAIHCKRHGIGRIVEVQSHIFTACRRVPNARSFIPTGGREPFAVGTDR